LITSISVISRYFFGYSMSWSIEISEYSLLYITFLAVPWILARNEHVTFDVIIDVSSKKVKRILNLVSYILGAGVCLLLAVFGAKVTIDNYINEVIIYNTIFMPKFILILVIPVGGALMFLEFIKKFLNELFPQNN